MQTSAIAAGVGAAAQTSDSSFGSMNSEDFFELLVTELKNQDPFEPQKTADMISQVSQIRSIELSGQLTDTLQLMTDQQRNLGAADLVGKYVEGQVEQSDGSVQLVSGVVTAVKFAADGQVVLELDTGQTIGAQDVELISTLEGLERMGVEALAGADETADDDNSADASADSAAKQENTAKPSWLQLDGTLRL